MLCSSHSPPLAQVGYQFVSTTCKRVQRSVEIGKRQSVLVKWHLTWDLGALFWNKEGLDDGDQTDHVIEENK